MNSISEKPKPNAMLDALRLTRAGRLTEATALLMRGAEPTAAPPAAATAQPRTGRMTDVDPATGAAIDDTKHAGWLDRLRDGLAGLVGRSPGSRDAAAATAPAATAGRFLTATYAGPAGGRDYKVYLPACPGDTPMPLIVMLHGCTQSPDDFAAGTRMNQLAEELGLIVAYPAQPSSANPNKCWNWFNPADQAREGGEAAIIAGITRAVMDSHPVDPARVYVAGLSAGGAAAAIMAERYPDLYAAVGVHSGLACGAARSVGAAFAAMRNGATGVAPARDRTLPTIVFHADRDTTVHLSNADAVLAQAAAGAAGLDTQVETGRVPAGHDFTRTVRQDSAGAPVLEMWVVHGAGHAWSGGSPDGSYTDPKGPDASREMARFFLAHRHPEAA